MIEQELRIQQVFPLQKPYIDRECVVLMHQLDSYCWNSLL